MKQNILAIIKDDLEEIKRKYGDDRRTEISGEELGNIDLEDLITEETMVVSISHQRLYQTHAGQCLSAQRRGGKGFEGRQDGG